MANPALDPETHKLIWQYGRQKLSVRAIRKVLQQSHSVRVSTGTVFNFRNIPPPGFHYSGKGIRSDKKLGSFEWEEWSFKLEEMQGLRKRASLSQDRATVELGDGTHPVAIVNFSDQHMGSWGCNYSLLRSLTHEIIDTPHLYIACLGDEGQYSIKLRSVLEVSDNIIPPEYQTKFVQDWFDHIWHKVAFATWDNHGVQRQEAQAGESSLKDIKSKRVVYFNGIGHIDLMVGDQIYKGCASHRFRGTSMLNPVHAIQRYMRMEGTDREFGMMGDTHTPGTAKYADGDKVRVAVNSGSLQQNSGYAKRFFSLTTHPVFPCIVFRHDRHEMVPFWSIKEALEMGAI